MRQLIDIITSRLEERSVTKHELDHSEFFFSSLLDRIVFDRTHFVGPIRRVDPLYIIKSEQIHRIDGSLS